MLAVLELNAFQFCYDIGLRYKQEWKQPKSGPSENSLATFCTSAHLKALKINLLFSKNTDGHAFKSAEEQKFAGEFSHGLNLIFCNASFMNIPIEC